MSQQYQTNVSQNDAASYSQPHILLVEDSPELREIMAEFLTKMGYSLMGAAHAAEALDLIKTGPHFDLVITDIIMPKVNGHEFAACLRQTQPNMKFLFISGYPTDVSRRSTDGFLAKPFRMVQLGCNVRELLLNR
jgi:two-component system cell cycle sensor histidine kinase/response regulator CckA